MNWLINGGGTIRGLSPGMKTGRSSYSFDRAYNKAEFWADIEAAEAFFVTRPKSNLAYDVHQPKLYPNSLIVADEIITLAGQPGRKYKKPLRRIEIFDEDKGREIAFITNDFQRSAEEVADLYKRRWQIELFFKWIKQNAPLVVLDEVDKMCDLTMFAVAKSRTTAYRSDACVIAVSPPKMDEHGTPPENREQA